MKIKNYKLKASVLIANYNNAKYIDKCLNSIVKQTYKNVEIIFVDDNSSDNSIIVAKKYSNRIKLIKNKIKTGIGSFDQIQTFYTALKESTGDIIFLLDSDDYFNKEKILSFLKFNKTVLHNELETKIFPLSHFQEVNKLEKIDILKIDTEGYELNVLKGIDPNHFKKIKYVYFEHHYDLMIKKNYTYSDIKNFLNLKGFYLSLKLKMKFRKTFEYVYENKKL